MKDSKEVECVVSPAMRIPSVIKDPMVIYHCMRTCLMTAMESGIDSIVIPAFGGGCGFVRPQVICEMMYHAYEQIMNLPSGSMIVGGDQKNGGDI